MTLLRLVAYVVATWIIETLVAMAFLHGRFRETQKGKPGMALWRDMLLVNALTNPLLNYASLHGVSFLPGEATVVLVEWPLYKLLLGLSVRDAAVLSLLANTASATLGILFA